MILQLSISLLNNSYVDVNAQTNDKDTALILAAYNGHADCVRGLLAHKDIDVNLQNQWGNSPLYCAVYSNHSECIKLLLSYPNINVNIRNNSNQTPFQVAKTDEIKNLLRAHGATE